MTLARVILGFGALGSMLSIVASPALGNDSVAGIENGQFVPRTTTRISMKSEKLQISRSRVIVDYTFENTTGQDLKEWVMFPFPKDYRCRGEEGDRSFISDFSVTVNDKLIRLQHQFLLNGKAIPERNVEKEIRGRLAEGSEDCVTVEESYLWEQTFPKRSLVKVHHEYKPSVGRGLWSLELDQKRKQAKFEGQAKETEKNFCVDEDFKKALFKRGSSSKSSGQVLTSETLEYVLMTAINWQNSEIGDFHLILDKGAADVLLSLCWTGLKKTGSTRFEFKASRYTPERDLKIWFLR